jgi:hypothetical protein
VREKTLSDPSKIALTRAGSAKRAAAILRVLDGGIAQPPMLR